MNHQSVLFFLLLLLTAPAAAYEKDYGWFGSFSFGGLIVTGNTEIANLTGSVKERYQSKQWEHGVQADVLRNNADSEVTAERYAGEYKLLYRYYPDISFFLSLRAVIDEFAGYQQQFFQTLGYRNTLVEKLWDTFAFEVGVGTSQQRRDDGNQEQRKVLRLGMEYEHEFIGGNTFTSDILSLLGKDNSNTVATTAVKTHLFDRVGLEFSVKVSHNSVVAADKKNTDTTTAIALVYDF